MPSLLHLALTVSFALTPVLSVPIAGAVFSRAGDTPLESYQCFTGTRFPTKYLPFTQLLAINQPFISQHNSPETVDNIISAIKAVASSASVSAELILAQIMQESGGDLSVVGDSGKSVGLMQVQLTAEAPVQCTPGQCTQQNIVDMLQQSVNGHTGSGAPVSPGIAFDLKSYGVGASLRVYNTGHLPDPNSFQTATKCSTSSYVSDVANRMLGLSPAVFPSPQDLQKLCGFVPATIC